MNKNVFLATLFSVSAAFPAHAGMFEWVDSMFTFREDQKERVMPRRSLPPKEIVVPYTDNYQQHQAQYYTRGDLAPVDYLHGSASKVVRPNTRPPSQRVAYSNVPTSYQAIARRDRQNQTMERVGTRIYVGEPGIGPDYGDDRTSPQHQRAKIGRPTTDWRATPNEMGLVPREGDYDYENRPQPRVAKVTRPETAKHSPWGRNQDDLQKFPSLADGKRTQNGYHQYSDQRKVSEYEVQRGDTLSGISDKPQVYGDWAMWPLIWDANRGTVKDPDMIHPRQKLGIPRDYTKSDARAAKKRAWDKGKEIYLDDGR
ncbi:MAG: LysM peptidoglycan-binding domain-containing protein [Alphaproteobacteria bacterium]|nr:LysM peptidoglycan-binding domain-containing protein [Alphaproteobacteria bacterium]